MRIVWMDFELRLQYGTTPRWMDCTSRVSRRFVAARERSGGASLCLWQVGCQAEKPLTTKNQAQKRSKVLILPQLYFRKNSTYWTYWLWFMICLGSVTFEFKPGLGSPRLGSACWSTNGVQGSVKGCSAKDEGLRACISNYLLLELTWSACLWCNVWNEEWIFLTYFVDQSWQNMQGFPLYGLEP